MSATGVDRTSTRVYWIDSFTVHDDPDFGEWEGFKFHFHLNHKSVRPSVADLVDDLRIYIEDVASKPNYRDPYVDVSDPDWREPPDDRAQWHRNTTPLEAWIRAHGYRLARDWSCSELHAWMVNNPEHTRAWGFVEDDDGLGAYTADPPSQSRLWEMWNEEFAPGLQAAIEYLQDELFFRAIENDIPAPRGVFEPEDRDINTERGANEYVAVKARQVWRQAKPFVMDTFQLPRDEAQSRVPEGSFWEAQAYAGMRQDAFAEGGVESYRERTSRPKEHQHWGRTHRHHLTQLDVEDIRSMLQETSRALVARARHRDELRDKVVVGIDVTKGNPWTGEIEWTDDDQPANPYIMGYKEDQGKDVTYHFQWATVQIVGLDVPLVLDAIPRKRGMQVHELVDELLEGALHVLPNIDLAVMDREFDVDKVRATCEDHGVHYLMPGRKYKPQKQTCARLHQQGKKVHVEHSSTLVGDRKELYLPARNTDLFEPVEDVELDDPDDDGGELTGIQDELISDFEDVVDENLEEDEDGAWFSDIIDEMREDEDYYEPPTYDEEAQAYAYFKTNHPSLETTAASEEALLKHVRGFIDLYSYRWGIENGYKQIKQFRMRTGSKDHAFRFFCFAFACVLYNVWRLVDLLVKLALEDDPAYSPAIKADLFLEIASDYIGLDPGG